ncbi:MAG: ubiquinol-cytochrome c reductase iron-sulfur subunit [Maricaulaceae bacterium]
MTDATVTAGHDEANRRDVIHLLAGSGAAIGAAAVAWPFIDQMNPAADTLALASIEIDMSQIQPGQQLTVPWRGKPIFVRHRTEDEIAAARDVPTNTLKDPQTDDERLIPAADGAVKPEYLVMIGVCTHLGCVPLGDRGDFGGWFCPCHGSHYDTAGRIRKGPAPANLPLPPYEYVSDTVIKIG